MFPVLEAAAGLAEGRGRKVVGASKHPVDVIGVLVVGQRFLCATDAVAELLLVLRSPPALRVEDAEELILELEGDERFAGSVAGLDAELHEPPA
jgi:hypothetical protein